MKNKISIRLGKYDENLKRWFKYVSKEKPEISLSALVTEAIEYRIRTGEYLIIGTIPEGSQDIEDFHKRLYLSQKSAAYEWLSGKEQEGKKITQLIKAILYNSIKVDQGYSVIERSLYHDSIIGDKVLSNSYESVIPVYTENVAQKVTETEKERVIERIKPRVEEIEELDLFDTLLPDIQF